MSVSSAEPRVAWVDVAKGLCILLVVMMHATLGVEKATGTLTPLNGFIEWARPFRMPDFFLISGLFLAARIARPWPQYLDTKVVHFAYFYVLWLTIQFGVKAYAMIASDGAAATAEAFLMGLVQPWGTLWFIYLLALFFVAAKLLEPLPKALVWGGAALIYLLAPKTGWLIADEFAARFVFFYTGYWAAPLIFRYAAFIMDRPKSLVAAALAVWAVANWALVSHGLAFVPGIDLVASYTGIAAVIAFSVLIAASAAGRGLGALGANSIAIYLAFPLFMGPARVIALKLDGVLPHWGAALVSTAAGVIGALLLARLVKGTRLRFLFERPAVLRIGGDGRLSPRFRERLSRAARPGRGGRHQPDGLASTTDFKAASPCS